jgi:hypothetical protein
MPNDAYRFIQKDPIIDVLRTECQRYGNLSYEQLSKLSYESGVAISTLQNWFFGETRFPRNLSTRFVLEALGVKVVYQREDGSHCRQHQPEMMPKAEQEKILKKERQREREREKAK